MPLASAEVLRYIKQFQSTNLGYSLFPRALFDFIQMLGLAELRGTWGLSFRALSTPQEHIENLHNASFDLSKVRDTPFDGVYKISNVERG